MLIINFSTAYIKLSISFLVKVDVTLIIALIALIALRVLIRLRRFVATESPLKVMKNVFYFASKSLFGHVEKRLDYKDKVNFKFDDVTAWLANNFNTLIAQYLEK